MRRSTSLGALLVLLITGCGRGDSPNPVSAAEPAAAAPTVPAGDPATLPKVAADERKIAAMLRERFGDAIARNIRVEVSKQSEGLRIGLTGEVPSDEFRVAVMNEVEARVEDIKFQDFNLTIAGPVHMLFGFDAFVRDNEPAFFAPDLSFVLTRTGSVYETATRRRVNRIDLRAAGDPTFIELSNDGRTLAVAYDGGEIALFDMPLGRNRRTLQPRGSETSFDNAVALGFSVDSRQLVSISHRNGDVRLWDLAKGSAKQIGSHIDPKDPHQLGDHYSIAMSPDGKTIATASRDQHELVLWDVASRSKLPTPKIDRLDSKVLAWSHDGKTIAVGRTTEENRGVALYDVAGKQSRKLSTENDELMRAIAFSPDDKTLAVSYESAKNAVRLWDVATATVWQSLDDDKVGQPTRLAFSPDGAVLATDCPGLRPASIRLWDVSQRPGAAPATAKLPPVLKDQTPYDDFLAAAVERRIRGTFGPRSIETLKVDVLPDGSIKLTGKVADSEVKRVAQLEAEVYHAPEDMAKPSATR